MDDFDIDALDNIDFDELESETEAKQKAKDEQANADIENLREGAHDCGDSCTI